MSKKKQILVSLLKSMYDTNPETVSLDAIYQFLILETLRSDTERHRYYKSTGQKKEAQAIKDKMTNFTASVLLSGGKSENHVVGYTSLGFSDFDHIPPTDLERCLGLLITDPYVVLAYVTISGEGIRVIYLTDVIDLHYHNDVFLQGNAYYSQLLGYPYDEHCINIARTSILAYCPQAIYHPEAEAMPIELSSQKEAEAAPMRKKRQRSSEQYKATVSEAEQPVLLQLEKDGKTYSEGFYNEYVSNALYLMNRFGVDESEACAWAVDRFTDYEASKVKSMAHSVYLHTDEHGVQKLPSEKIKCLHYASIPELKKFISSQAKVRNNVVTGCREIRFNEEDDYRDIADRDENTLWVRASETYTLHPKAIQIMLNSEYVDNYDPFTSYLFELDPWDGKTDYIRLLTDTVQTSAPDLFSVYFRKWFVAFIASLINPAIVNHEVLVFIGKQGLYKTTWMNRLLPPQWERYFFTKTNSRRTNKDDNLSLSEFALLCFEEIDHMRPSEMNQFKAMVTLPSINERPSYAHNKTHRPHIASFCGTGNNITFLNDPTGTRRWLAFEVLSIDNPYEMTLPYHGLYAQGLALYRSGFRYWFNREEIALLEKHNEQFEVPCLERELVQMYYRKPHPGEHSVFVSTAEILQRINGLIKNPLSIMSLGMALHKLGFQSCRYNNIRGYRVVELTPTEISERKHNIDQPKEEILLF